MSEFWTNFRAYRHACKGQPPGARARLREILRQGPLVAAPLLAMIDFACAVYACEVAFKDLEEALDRLNEELS